MYAYKIIILTFCGLVGIALYIGFLIAKAKVTRRNPTVFARPSKTPALIYLFIPVVLFCVLVRFFLADLFWRTLETEVPLSAIFLLSIGLGYFLVRRMKNSSLFAEVEGPDRALCCIVLFAATLVFPASLVLTLNYASLKSPPFSRTAVVTNKMTGRDKSGRLHDYVAFKGSQISEFGGVQVNPVLYDSVEPGSKLVVYLKTGWLGFPVIVGIVKG
jgi:hypothetical protein